MEATTIDHPLIRTRLTRLRDKACSPEEFRRILLEIGQLNEVGYILPGLGDAGDRCFGTL